MAGWRIGWACGNKKLIDGLVKLKENIDSGVFEAIQYAGIVALKEGEKEIEKIRKIYKKRRDLFASGLKNAGFNFNLPKGTFYFWVNVGEDSINFVDKLLQKCKIIAAPGVGFGVSGNGFIRFSITISEEKLKKAVERWEEIRKK